MSRDRLQEPYVSPRRIREQPKLESFGHNSSPARLMRWLRSEGTIGRSLTANKPREPRHLRIAQERLRMKTDALGSRAQLCKLGKRVKQPGKAPMLIGPTAQCGLILLDSKSEPIGSGSTHESCT